MPRGVMCVYVIGCVKDRAPHGPGTQGVDLGSGEDAVVQAHVVDATVVTNDQIFDVHRRWIAYFHRVQFLFHQHTVNVYPCNVLWPIYCNCHVYPCIILGGIGGRHITALAKRNVYRVEGIHPNASKIVCTACQSNNFEV